MFLPTGQPAAGEAKASEGQTRREDGLRATEDSSERLPSKIGQPTKAVLKVIEAQQRKPKAESRGRGGDQTTSWRVL